MAVIETFLCYVQEYTGFFTFIPDAWLKWLKVTCEILVAS